MNKNKALNISEALTQIPSRFELIAVAARRARQIQDYEAEVAKAENKLRNTSTLLIAQARAKMPAGSKETRVESSLKELQNNPVKLFVDNEDNDKPTVVALREIQTGLVTKKTLDMQNEISSMQMHRNVLQTTDKLAREVEEQFSYEFNMDEDDFDDE